jgi:PAS domain S-box-containing protein
MGEARILIVEDEGIEALDLQHRLTSMGYAVPDIVATGEEAVSKAAETRPDLVLMDIMLQGDIDGVTAAARIHARFDTPVIFITAYADEDTLQRAKVTEPYGYLIKPFQERELQITIEMALYKHQMERKLKESERLLATTLRSIGDAVITTDNNGLITFLNPAAERLLGWKLDEVVNQKLPDVFKIINRDSRQAVENPVVRVFREGMIVGLANHSLLIARDGKEIPIDDSGAPIRDDQGEMIGVVLVFRDVTEREWAEELLLKSQRLESIGILAGGIAHDFNNILTAILGNIELARMSLPPEAKAHDRLAAAVEAAVRARGIAQHLLTFAKGGAPIKQVVSAGDLIRGAVDFALQGTNVKCEYALAPDLWCTEADEGQLHQVINNLVINACQAMPEGGIVKVDARNESIGGKNSFGLTEGKYVRVDIIDQGTGIPGRYLHKIFDPYFTTKGAGSGLGLAIAYSIIKRHGGTIIVDSAPGKGSTFSFFLPVSGEKKDWSRASGEEEETLPGASRILVMDDEEAVNEATADMLRYLGYRVATVRDGAEAVAAYGQALDKGEPFAAVITDLTVPGGIGGQETVRRLLAIDPQAKVIVTSCYADDPIISDYPEHGFKGMLVKPYQLAELGGMLGEVIGEDRQVVQSSNR